MVGDARVIAAADLTLELSGKIDDIVAGRDRNAPRAIAIENGDLEYAISDDGRGAFRAGAPAFFRCQLAVAEIPCPCTYSGGRGCTQNPARKPG
jgi:hypothetical protein